MAANRKRQVFASCLILLCQIIISVDGRRQTREMIYVDINHFAPCVRRFNATHEIGCTSSASGNTGVVHYINENSELEYLVNDGPHKPYIPIMTPQMFNLPNVEKLLNSKKVNGIVVIHSNVSDILAAGDVDFSPDRSCPNDNFGLYNEEDNSTYAHCSDVTWNPDGNSLNYMNLEVPVFSLLHQGEVDGLVECAVKFNHPIDGELREYPLCAVELYNFMFGAKDTPTCYWRSQWINSLEQTQFCDPLGGFNLWSVLKPTNKNKPLQDKSVVFVAAQLDATSLFYEIMPRPGADSAVTSFVTLLAVAEALGKLSDGTKRNMKNIMFAFFTGESYDYIGSSRMVYDMQRDQFPSQLYEGKKAERDQPALMNLTHISHYVELKQLGVRGMSGGDKVWAHYDPVSQEDPVTEAETNKIINALQQSSQRGRIKVNTPLDPNQSLPPASFQRFLKENRQIPGIVLTDHEKEYTNKYYNSRFDIPEWVDPSYKYANETTETQLAKDLTDIATTVARAVYQLASNESWPNLSKITADSDTVRSLLYCFLINSNCTLFKEVASPDEAKALSYQNTSYSNYVGVYDGYTTPTTAIVRRLLAYYTGESTAAKNEKECAKRKSKTDDIFTYSFIQGPEMNKTYGLCVKSIASASPALSPAFINNTKESWSSTEYSTWTESRWSSYSARIFLKPSQEQQSIIFSLGMIVLLVSLTTSYFLNAKASVLFAPNRTSY